LGRRGRGEARCSVLRTVRTDLRVLAQDSLPLHPTTRAGSWHDSASLGGWEPTQPESPRSGELPDSLGATCSRHPRRRNVVAHQEETASMTSLEWTQRVEHWSRRPAALSLVRSEQTATALALPLNEGRTATHVRQRSTRSEGRMGSFSQPDSASRPTRLPAPPAPAPLGAASLGTAPAGIPRRATPR